MSRSEVKFMNWFIQCASRKASHESYLSSTSLNTITLKRKTLHQSRSDMDNSEASRSQKEGGRSVLVLNQPLPHILKGVLGNIIYKKALNGQKTTTETAVISSVFSSSLKSLTRTRDHTHHCLSHRYSPVPTSFRNINRIHVNWFTSQHAATWASLPYASMRR